MAMYFQLAVSRKNGAIRHISRQIAAAENDFDHTRDD
jgi:hypothetical protein